ncbi:MAG TPA: hypothetical protein VGM13_05735 [Thermoanaerobaculia bacterium]
MRPLHRDLEHRDFVALAMPWLAITAGVLLEVITLLVLPVAPLWILFHFALNPLAYVATSLIALLMYRAWRAPAASLGLLLGIALCGLLAYHSVTGQVWPYSPSGRTGRTRIVSGNTGNRMTLETVQVHVRAWWLVPVAFLAVACSTLHVRSNVSVDNLTEDVVRDLINRVDIAHYARDPEAVLRLLAPDFQMETHQDCGSVTVRTRSDYDAFMRDQFEHALDFRWDRTIEAIEIAADRQSAVMRASGTERAVWPSGTTVSAADTVTEIRLDQGRPVVSRLAVRCKPSEE